MNKILTLSKNTQKNSDLLLESGLKEAQVYVSEDLKTPNAGFDQINIVFGDSDLIEEPLSASHPFWNTPGIIITSHSAAVSYPEDIVPIFIENYHCFQSEKPLKYLLDLKHGN